MTVPRRGVPWTAQRIAGHPARRACAGCGAEFTALHPVQRYCTPACRDRATSRRAYWRKKRSQPLKDTLTNG